MKQGDAEREMLRRELHRLREQCHENSLLHGHVVSEVDNSIESTQSGDLEKIEVRFENQFSRVFTYLSLISTCSNIFQFFCLCLPSP